MESPLQFVRSPDPALTRGQLGARGKAVTVPPVSPGDSPPAPRVKVTICTLLYGDHPQLARRALESIRRRCPRQDYRLAVGANAVGPDTRAYLDRLQSEGAIDCLVDSTTNLNKCPMMRRLFAQVDTEYIWWFDDDSYLVDSNAFCTWLDTAEQAPKDVVMWGKLAVCDHSSAFAPDREDAPGFVRGATWYRGLPPPSWRAGGKGELNFAGCGLGDGRWFFILGGCWLIRTSAVRALDWPDRRLVKMGDDVFLGEAIRQQGWQIANIGTSSIAVNAAPRRGDPGLQRPAPPAPVPAFTP